MYFIDNIYLYLFSSTTFEFQSFNLTRNLYPHPTHRRLGFPLSCWPPPFQFSPASPTKQKTSVSNETKNIFSSIQHTSFGFVQLLQQNNRISKVYGTRAILVYLSSYKRPDMKRRAVKKRIDCQF